MFVSSHIVHTKIAEARARGALDLPVSDETRALKEIERLLGELGGARGLHAVQLRAQLAVQERSLAFVLARTGQSVVADTLFEHVPVYDV